MLGCVLLVGAVVVSNGPASADRVSVRDSDDTDGRLDIRTATSGHGPALRDGGRRLRFTLTTYEPWRTRVLGRRPRHDKHTISFWISTNGRDCCAERTIDVSRSHRGITAQVCCFRSGPERRRIPAWRPDRSSVRVALRPSLLPHKRGKFHWFAEIAAEFSKENCGGGGGGGGPPPAGCIVDRAPNGGWMLHGL